MEIRLGIIGTGRIAKRFVSSVKAVEGVRVSCVYNPHKESVEEFARAYGIISCTDQWDMFLEKIDAGYIASPHGTHTEYAKALLEVGKHVLCEKPMCFREVDAVQLYELAGQKHCILQEAVKTAYCPGFLAMIDMAKRGKIGQICDVEGCFTKLIPTNLREMTDSIYGGSVMELGSYVLLPIWKLLGTQYLDLKFQSLYAPNGVDIYTKLIFTYEKSMAIGKTGLGVKSEGQLLISGTKGYILCEAPWWLTKKFEVRYEDSNQNQVFEYPFEGSGLQYELEAFKQRICGDTIGLCAGVSPEESIASASVMESYLKQRLLESK